MQVPEAPQFRVPLMAPQSIVAELETAFGMPLQWAEVELHRTHLSEDTWRLCHVADTNLGEKDLKQLSRVELREWANWTHDGAFRPLRSAPSLRRGWFVKLVGTTEVVEALDTLYPGSIADWLATHDESNRAASFQEFTGRQTGMYRITQLLSAQQASEVVRAGCHSTLCLKHRWWKIESVAERIDDGKCAIPCWEPCPLLIELARRRMKMEQEERLPVAFGVTEWSSIQAALEQSLRHPDPGIREGDMNAATNPRRIRLLLTKLCDLVPEAPIEDP